VSRAVTRTRKRYVFLCLGCDFLADSTRSDALTCSPACRVRVHRHPEGQARLRKDAEAFGITPASILQAAAIYVLRPDLGDAVLAGTRTLADIEPEIYGAYLARVLAAERALEADTTSRGLSQ
jgi:hypothetical protein